MKVLTGLLPKGAYKSTSKGEFLRLNAEFADRFQIGLSEPPTGVAFLEGTVIARNKIVHNAAMLWEGTSNPNPILTEGDESRTPSDFDQDFCQRFPIYVDGDRVTNTKEVFETNAQTSRVFVEWLAERFDTFVGLMSTQTGGAPS